MKIETRLILSLLALLLNATAWAACSTSIEITKPDSNYTDHGNGTVTDHETGLMWMQCTQGLSGAGCAAGSVMALNWKRALEAAQLANTANSGAGTFGYMDWRLPSQKELETLLELACYSPVINSTLFPATVRERYWTSSPFSNASNQAWFVNFDNGVKNYDFKLNPYMVRLVRGGQ